MANKLLKNPVDFLATFEKEAKSNYGKAAHRASQSLCAWLREAADEKLARQIRAEGKTAKEGQAA